MAIKGLSDRDSVDPRFKEIGRLRKGEAKSGNRPGRDLDYFRFVPDNGRADIAEAFEKAYGKEPTHLQVWFPFDTMERVFGSWREAYGQNRLCKLRCDGTHWRDWIDKDRHYHSEEGRPCDLDCKDVDNKCPQCPTRHVGRLSVILEDLWFAGHIGLVTVITSSINDIGWLASKLVQWEPLTNKPFMLWRADRRIGVPIKGKRTAKDVSLLHLELTEEQLKTAFLEYQAPAQLEAPEGNGGAYDEGLVEGDSFLMGDAPDIDYDGHPMDADAYDDQRHALEQEPAEQGRDCVPANWREFHERALANQGDFRGYYTAKKHVVNTVRQAHANFGKRGDNTSIAKAWSALWDHVESKQANGETTPATTKETMAAVREAAQAAA